MSEVLSYTLSPEEVVFGNAFSFENGEASRDVVAEFFKERQASKDAGEKTWIPRTLDARGGIYADLYKGGKAVATINISYDDFLANAYKISRDGDLGDTRLCFKVSFAEAVAAADKYAEEQQP